MVVETPFHLSWVYGLLSSNCKSKKVAKCLCNTTYFLSIMWKSQEYSEHTTFRVSPVPHSLATNNPSYPGKTCISTTTKNTKTTHIIIQFTFFTQFVNKKYLLITSPIGYYLNLSN